MPLPLLGVALNIADMPLLQDWILADQRPVEIQDFVFPDIIAGDHAGLIADWQTALQGHEGPRSIHGPFFGLDLSNPDLEIRALVQKRLLTGLDIAEALGADLMVVHSPFTYWHLLNRRNYPFIEANMFEAMADCLAPVLDRARQMGCTLALENIDDTDPTARVRFVEQMAHDKLKVSLDTGHAELAHGSYNAPPVVDFVAAASGQLAHVHLQDADGHADRHWHPGEGCIPWGPVFAGLADMPEPPRLILEVRSRKERLPDTVKALKARGLAR